MTITHSDLTTSAPDVTPLTVAEFVHPIGDEPEPLSRLAKRTLTSLEGGFFDISAELVHGRQAVGVAQVHDSGSAWRPSDA